MESHHINKVDEIRHNQCKLVTFHAYTTFTEFVFNHKEGKIIVHQTCMIGLFDRSGGRFRVEFGFPWF